MTNEKTITRFTRNFLIGGLERTVEFHPVNVAIKQLYQIYIPVSGKPFRIHMQKNTDGKFLITAKDRVPEDILAMEEAFELAILEM